MAQDIARIYQQCDPASALPPNDPRYVNRENTRGEGDLVCQLANAIRWSETPQHLLFAGHRGGGKSTELLRLQHALTNPAGGEAKFFVVYFEADEEDIDINDADFPDVLLAIIRQVGRAVREQAGIDLRPPLLDRLFSDLKRLLGSEVEFEKLELDAKIAKFTAAIRSSPDARHEIRRALEPNVSSLIQEANKLFDEAAAYVGESGYHDIVLIVDNLDRIVLRDIPGSQFNTHEQLFINRGAQLAQLRCHVVYTLPISIVFTPKGTTLANIFGRRPEVLPMVKIANRDGKGYPAGMAAMREIVRKRLGQAGVAESTAFDSGLRLWTIFAG